MNDERTINAVHEAGHATVNCLLGLPFTVVKIEPTPCLVWGAEHAWFTPSTGRYLAGAVSSLAGAAGVAVLLGESDDGGAVIDYRHAQEKLSKVPDAPSVEAAYSVAFAMLYTARAALLAVAKELLASGELPYARVIALVLKLAPKAAIESARLTRLSEIEAEVRRLNQDGAAP